MKSGAESEHMSTCSELAAYGSRESGVMLYSSWGFFGFLRQSYGQPGSYCVISKMTSISARHHKNNWD